MVRIIQPDDIYEIWTPEGATRDGIEEGEERPGGESPDAAWSHATAASGTIRIYVSGQVAFDENNEFVGKDDVEAQTEQIFENIGKILEEAGAGPEDVTFVKSFLLDMEELYPEVGTIRNEFFGDHSPAISSFEVPNLWPEHAKVEIEVIADIDE